MPIKRLSKSNLELLTDGYPKFSYAQEEIVKDFDWSMNEVESKISDDDYNMCFAAYIAGMLAMEDNQSNYNVKTRKSGVSIESKNH